MNSLNEIIKIDGSFKKISGLTKELQSIYLYNRFIEKDESIVFLVPSLYEATNFYQSISNYTKDVLLFPMDDFITSEALAISPELMLTRLETLNTIITNQKKIVVTNLMGFLRFLPTQSIYKNKLIELEVGSEIKIGDLAGKLNQIGYERDVIVDRTGHCAVRGFVVDLFPINTQNPIRIEFFGDEIESIRYFDPNTQKTISKIDSITIYPNTEFLTETEVEEKSQKYLPNYGSVANIVDYLGKSELYIHNEEALLASYTFLKEEIKQYNASLGNEELSYMHELEPYLNNYFVLNSGISNGLDNYNFKSSELPFMPTNPQELESALISYLSTGKMIVIALSSRYLINKILDNISNPYFIYTSLSDLKENKINLINLKMESGFETEDFVFITDRELFKTESHSKYHSSFKLSSKVADISKINVGDYIVHYNHGIGQYLGIQKLIKNGIEKDYIVLKYRGTDKLYVPVEKIDAIKKYSSNEEVVPKLNKLGNGEWEKTKERIETRVKSIAKELLTLYASRELKKGFAFLPDGELQKEFEEQCEFEATPDQLRVVSEIKKDMELETPMDRLLCGDVGFGKTEVAFRVIFKAIMSNKQVALLCPTTILSFQHYTNAIKRFKNFPVNIAVVNRFVTPSRLREIKKLLSEGRIDLLIGTHRILSEDIKFCDLGMLVIDEEQRFGVVHKEKIKQYKNNIDVLTLTATPIPRTLQMTFAGIRNLSLIETAPSNRYPVQTYVIARNNQLIKDAVYKEMSRDGQVFILYNKVSDMNLVLYEMQRLLPDLRITIAHGKMDKRELEDVMIAFTNHEYDVLICTTIIETGIDIPRVNTLIIMDADRFGLSQLYQIRGRVGRSDRIAYCYLMYDNFKGLTSVAAKRLNIIKEFTKLGSGFSIAMRDLAIRGAGDILGSEQAGFVDTVGVELFLNMLENEVKRLKGESVAEVSTDEVMPLIDVSTSIDDSYISEEELKVEIHKLINSIDSRDKLIEVKAELEDRFGKISEKMNIYMHNEYFEKLAAVISIKNIRQLRNYVEIIIPDFVFENMKLDDLFFESQKISRMFRFTTRGRNLVIILDTIKLENHFIYYLVELFEYIKREIEK